MDIQSKINIGDKIYSISCISEKILEKCTACDGEAELTCKDGSTVKCPVCSFNQYSDKPKGRIETGRRSFNYTYIPLTIGQIKVIITRNIKTKKIEHQEEYMCYETGIGSGSVYRWPERFKENELFFTEQDAIAYCDSKNGKP